MEQVQVGAGQPVTAKARPEECYALIGAGPMGLAMAKVLKEQGIPFQGFELHSDVGGLWDIDGPKSTMYESAHLISRAPLPIRPSRD